MLLTTHAAAGIAISQHLHNPLAVLGLAILSHFVLDFVPHGDQKIMGGYNSPRRWKPTLVISAIDVVVLVALIFWLAGQPLNTSTYLMMIGVLGGVLPDLLSNFFPLIHERMSWLWLIRWLDGIFHRTGLKFFTRQLNWIHVMFHHRFRTRDVSFKVGLAMQIVLNVVFVLLSV